MEERRSRRFILIGLLATVTIVAVFVLLWIDSTRKARPMALADLPLGIRPPLSATGESDPGWEKNSGRWILAIRTSAEDEDVDLDGSEDMPCPILLALDADDAWNDVATRVRRAAAVASGLWLATREPSDRLMAVVLFVPDEFTEGLHRVFENYGAEGLGGKQVEVRVTRDGDLIRYQWGSRFAAMRLSGGDVTLSSDDVVNGRVEALESLREVLKARSPSASTRLIVDVRADDDARVVDVVRAIECGGGRGVFFCPGCEMIFEDFEIPVSTGGSRGILKLDRPSDVEVVIANVLRDGGTIIKKIMFDAEGVREHLDQRLTASGGRLAVRLRMDRRTPWRLCRPVVTAALALGTPVLLAYGDEPGLDDELDLELPGASQEPTSRLDVPTDASPIDLARSIERGQVVALRPDPEASVGTVLMVVLEIHARGAFVRLD